MDCCGDDKRMRHLVQAIAIALIGIPCELYVLLMYDMHPTYVNCLNIVLAPRRPKYTF